MHSLDPLPERRKHPISLDIIIPVYNESSVMPVLTTRLAKVFETSACDDSAITTVRFIFVDDGSSDDTASQVVNFMDEATKVKLVRFTRNFGHQAAVSAGLDEADADVVAIIDGDLQDPPELIHDMIEKWREGFDVVYGVRQNRKENFLLRTAYNLFYIILHFLSEGLIPKDSGDFGIIDRRVLREVGKLRENIRFFRGLRAWVGFRQFAFKYDRHSRFAGEPKYSLKELYNLATDGIASCSLRPLKITQLMAMIFFCMSAVLAAVFAGKFFQYPQLEELQLIIYSGLLFVSLGFFGVFACLYILGAYLGRVYIEVKARPPYVLLEVIENAKQEECY